MMRLPKLEVTLPRFPLITEMKKKRGKELHRISSNNYSKVLQARVQDRVQDRL